MKFVLKLKSAFQQAICLRQSLIRSYQVLRYCVLANFVWGNETFQKTIQE